MTNPQEPQAELVEVVARAIVAKTQEQLCRTFGDSADMGGFDGYNAEGKADALEVARAALAASDQSLRDRVEPEDVERVVYPIALDVLRNSRSNGPVTNAIAIGERVAAALTKGTNR